MENTNTHPQVHRYQSRTASFRSKRTFGAALFLLSALQTAEAANAHEHVRKLGVRHGKHSGQQPGAFGKTSAKPHRLLYTRPSSEPRLAQTQANS